MKNEPLLRRLMVTLKKYWDSLSLEDKISECGIVVIKKTKYQCCQCDKVFKRMNISIAIDHVQKCKGIKNATSNKNLR